MRAAPRTPLALASHCCQLWCACMVQVKKERKRDVGASALTCPSLSTLLVNLVKHEQTSWQLSLTRAVEEGRGSP